MPRKFSAAELAACGEITESEMEPLVRGRFRVPQLRYVWRPSGLTASQLPPNFELTLEAYLGSDGVRRFHDANAHVYARKAFAAGVAILDHLRGFTRAQRIAYRAPIFIYDYVQQTQAHLDCNFRSRSQLFIKRGSRGDDGEPDVLPSDLGFSAAGRGPRWTIDKLLSEGAGATAAEGIVDPSDKDKIRSGLYVAARRRPLRRNATEARADLRRALFDTEALVAAPGRRLTAIVQDRLYRLLDRHLDDSQEKFNEWFFPAGGRNLPRAIGRQPNRPGGILTNEEVTGVLLHLAWKAYGSTATAIGAVGQAFQAALAQPLTRQEKAIFDWTLMPHRSFGGLTRLMLMERGDFLRPALEDLLSDPRDRVALGAMHRLLVWYPEMVSKRRAADRRNKRRSSGRRQELNGLQDVMDRDLKEDGRLEDRYRRRRRNSTRRADD